MSTTEEPSLEIEIDSDRQPENPARGPGSGKPPVSRSLVRRAMWLVAFGLFLGLGLVGLALWQADRVVNRFVPELQAWLGSAAGTSIAIGRVETGWRGFRPEVRIVDLKIGKAGSAEPSASATRLELELDLSESLVGLTPRFRRMAAHSLHVLAAGASRPSGPLLATELTQALGSHLATGFELIVTDLEWKEPERFTLTVADARARIRLKTDHWEGDLKAKTAVITAPSFWLRPLTLEKLETPLSLQGLAGSPPKLVVILEPAVATTPEVELGIALKAEWTNELNSLPKLELQLDSGEATLATIRGLLPVALFGHELKLWIDTAVQQGSTSGVSLKLSGPSQDWAQRGIVAFKDPAVSKLEVELPFTGATVDYLDGWPQVEAASGKLIYRQTDLAVEVTQASSVHAQLRDGHVLLSNLHEPNPLIRISSQVESTPEQLTGMLSVGILSGLKQALEKGTPEGIWKARFEAAVPLEKGDWQADLEILTGGFALKKPAIHLTDFLAHASLKPAAISFQGGKARWGERVMEWSLTTNAHSAAKKKETRVVLNGAFETTKLREAIPELALPAFVQGSSLWKIETLVTHEEVPLISIEGHSTLVGSKIDLPPPLKKDEQEEWPLSFKTKWSGSLLVLAQGFFSGAGNEAELEYRPPVVKAQIKTGAIDLELWSKWAENLKTEPVAPVAGETASPPWAGVVRITSPEIKWKAHHFTQANVQLDAGESLYTLTLKSEGLKGKIEASRPWKQGKIKADLSELVLAEWPFDWPPQPTDGVAEAAPATAPVEEPLPPAWDMRDWPSIVFKADGFKIGEEDMGELRLKLSKGERKFTLDFARWYAGAFELFTKSGEVILGETPGAGSTSIEGELKLKKFSRPTPFIKSAQAVSIPEGHAGLKASWPGTPNQFRLSKATGEANAYLASGKLNGVKSFIQTLFNTLSLNFEDSRKQIMRFSKLTFDAGIVPGKVTVREARALFGTVFAKLEGSLSYPERALQMEAMITPAVTDLEEDDVGFTPDSPDSNEARRMAPKTFFTHRYSVGGTWEKPQISLRGQ